MRRAVSRRPLSLPPALLLVALLAAFGPSIAVAADSSPPVDFARQIRPVLSDKCFVCHGNDESSREADLRLDIKEGAFGDLGGYRAIVPGKPDESELWARISNKDEDERMPPPEAEHRLNAEEIERIRRWIAAGAPWDQHWAFVKPRRPELPQVEEKAWCRNAIDAFVLARLEREGLKPSPAADRRTLIRRVTLDLTGLPPTLEQVDAFLADQSPQAYEKLVDRLLASPRYGEQMTRYWLDAARYGDTHGMHLDNQRSIWPYRDWVIRAFNADMPFDRFTVVQLAGDLLPEATVQDRVATGFNRCNVSTSEGGAIDEEFRVRYAVDRVKAIGSVWLGLTIGCAVCHDHKFDPISQKEFYELFAFYNSTADKPMDGNALLPPPVVKLPTPQQAAQAETYRKAIAELEAQVKAELARIEYVDPVAGDAVGEIGAEDFVWIDDALPAGAEPQGDGPQPWQFVSAGEFAPHSGEKSTRRTSAGRSQHFFTGAAQPLVVGSGDVLFAHVYLDGENPPRQIMLQFNDGSWEHRVYWGENLIDWGKDGSAGRHPGGSLPAAGGWVRLEVPAAQVGLKPGAKINGWAFTQFAGTVHWDTAGIHSKTPQAGRGFESLAVWEKAQQGGAASSLPKPVQDALKVAADKRNDAQKKQVHDYFLEHVCSATRHRFDPLHGKLDEVKKKQAALEKKIPATLVMADMAQPRQTHVLHRGQYDQPRETVQPDVPSILPPMKAGLPANRLGLARWLVDADNPLPARVTVNRFWQHYFGTGLVKTTDDFGSQGDPPSHPKLLDWLATEFLASGWDVKKMQRLMVTSATYRQTSAASGEAYARDPDNRLLARGPRFRLDAEVVRDNALAISGLLVGTIGGPSVKPYQPGGLWKAVGYTSSNTANFVQDHGEALYRRSMYTFWKRTSPPPTMLLMDAPSRETCTVRRARTNTPLAALALLNDVQFFEAARKFAERVIHEAGPTPQERIGRAFRLALARPPTDSETKTLLRLYQAQRADYQADPAAAKATIAAGEAPRDEQIDPVELAAWTVVANCILNLDETITKN